MVLCSKGNIYSCIVFYKIILWEKFTIVLVFKQLKNLESKQIVRNSPRKIKNRKRILEPFEKIRN